MTTPPDTVKVPREATEGMIRAGYGAFMAAHDPFFAKNEPVGPIWKAMLAAAPAPEPSPELEKAAREAMRQIRDEPIDGPDAERDFAEGVSIILTALTAAVAKAESEGAAWAMQYDETEKLRKAATAEVERLRTALTEFRAEYAIDAALAADKPARPTKSVEQIVYEQTAASHGWPAWEGMREAERQRFIADVPEAIERARERIAADKQEKQA